MNFDETKQSAAVIE